MAPVLVNGDCLSRRQGNARKPRRSRCITARLRTAASARGWLRANIAFFDHQQRSEFSECYQFCRRDHHCQRALIGKACVATQPTHRWLHRDGFRVHCAARSVLSGNAGGTGAPTRATADASIERDQCRVPDTEDARESTERFGDRSLPGNELDLLRIAANLHLRTCRVSPPWTLMDQADHERQRRNEAAEPCGSALAAAMASASRLRSRSPSKND
jgi:hypothetical protein